MMIAMVAPRVTRERQERQRALVHWDSLLHDTLQQLRDALVQIKELDRKEAGDARQGSTEEAG